MQIQIQAPWFPDLPSFHDTALARVRLMLRRLGPDVIRVCIRLAELNGSRRSDGSRQCEVTLHTQSRGVLVVRSRARHAGAALVQALRRAVRALLLGRRSRPGRLSLRAGGAGA